MVTAENKMWMGTIKVKLTKNTKLGDKDSIHQSLNQNDTLLPMIYKEYYFMNSERF